MTNEQMAEWLAAAGYTVAPPEKPPELATVIPMTECGLHINAGRDGTWLHFTASNGKSCSINADVMAAQSSGIRSSALHQWCADRQKQAATVSD